MEKRLVFEVQREGSSVVIWLGSIGSRVVFDSEPLAIQAEDMLLEDERQFREAKEVEGVPILYKYGEHLSPFEYIQRLFKVYRSPIGRCVGATVFENSLSRDKREWW